MDGAEPTDAGLLLGPVRGSGQRSRDRAHHRYLSALKALAQVRKLALPALQVNIAKEQVNVSG